MLRRQLLVSAIGLAAAATGLSACANAGTTIQGILDWLKSNCGFVTTFENVVQVIITIVANFNPAAGATAVVVDNVAKQVEQAICGAVQAKIAAEPHVAAMAAQGTPQRITVIVNGVEVTGTLVK